MSGSATLTMHRSSETSSWTVLTVVSVGRRSARVGGVIGAPPSAYGCAGGSVGAAERAVDEGADAGGEGVHRGQRGPAGTDLRQPRDLGGVPAAERVEVVGDQPAAVERTGRRPVAAGADEDLADGEVPEVAEQGDRRGLVGAAAAGAVEDRLDEPQ